MMPMQTLGQLFADKLAEIKYHDIQAHLQEVRPDILITFGWRRLVPAEIINSAKIAVNIHPALLPAYRGYHPVPHVLINREKVHGITAHMITSKMDDGEIVSQVRFAIDRFSTLNQIQNRVNALMPAFLRQLCEKLSCGEFKLTKNEESKAKVVAGKRTPKDSEIPLSMTLGRAYDFIRACDENRFPAYILIEGRKVEIRMKLVE